MSEKQTKIRRVAASDYLVSTIYESDRDRVTVWKVEPEDADNTGGIPGSSAASSLMAQSPIIGMMVAFAISLLMLL